MIKATIQESILNRLRAFREQPEESEGHTANPGVGRGNKVSEIREKSVFEVLHKGFLA